MARIAQSAKSPAYIELLRAACAKGERNDCGVKAVALCAEIPSGSNPSGAGA